MERSCDNCIDKHRLYTCPIEGCFEIDKPDEYFGWRPDYEELEKQVKSCKEILEKLRTIAWQDRDYEMHENLNTFFEAL